MNSDQKGERSKDQSTSNDIRSYSKISQFEINDESQNDRNISELKRRKIMQENIEVNETSISQLLAKTIINSKNVSQEQETQYRQEIQKWFKDVRKVKYCKELLDVVTQCDNLKIVFDFENELVNNTAIYDCTSSGFPFLGGSISIGAKMSDTRREQEIKGVLARELCRYAICLTYENTYHKHDITATQQFDEIVKIIDKWTSEDSDGLNRIISSVIRTLTPDNIQMELIATAVQILVQFNDDIEELTRFEVKFKILFDYFENFVLPEMKKLNLKFREKVRKFNRNADILPNILSLELELSELKDVKSLTENSFSIIHTNFPKLLLFNIQKCLQIDQGNLFDSKNIFVSTENLKSQKLLEDYQNLLSQDPNLNIFVIFSGKIDENLKNIFACKSSKFTLIVSDESQYEELIHELSLNPIRIEVNYGWNDLTVDSQKLLVQMKINFQNYSEFSFLDILKDEFNPEDMETLRNFSEIIDDQLLGLMLENSEISVNLDLEREGFDEVIFKERSFVKREVMKDIRVRPDWKPKIIYQSISQQEFLNVVRKEEYVIISDKPGSGKSWTMKNFLKILRKQNPTSWVTYVDLKNFNVEFIDLMTKRCVPEFPVYITENILKLQSKFEIKIFTKMYELGKVFIFFDQFDKLAPNCAEFVSKLIKSFEFNEGNQLWIATRDHIEVDLEQILELNVKYKLDEITEEDSVDMIAASWVLNDIKDDPENKSGIDIRCSENFNSYQKLAKDLLNKNSISKFESIGMHLCCKIIAEITKDDKTSTTELTELKIFRKFTQNLYRKWTSQGNSETENQELIFWTFHEILAMKSLFPNYSDFCDLYPENLKAWSNEDIAAGDLVIRNRESYDFLHETFRDFFVAEFILRILKKDENYEKIFPFLMKILTVRRHEVTRMFLNQGFDDLTELKLSDRKVKILAQNLDECTIISIVFGENLENLGNILIMSLKRKKYEVVKTILINNFDEIFNRIKNSNFPVNPKKFLDFFVMFLKSKCLKDLLKEKSLLIPIIESCENIEHFEDFLNNLKAKVGKNEVNRTLQMIKPNSQTESNIFFYFCWSKKIDSPKIQKFFKILKKYMSVREITKLMIENGCRNILTFCIDRGDSGLLRTLWTEIEKFFISNECLNILKDKIIFGYYSFEGIISSASYCHDVEFYETLWALVLKILGQEALKDLTVQKPSLFNEHFIFDLTNSIRNLQIIARTFEIFEEIFTNKQFEEFMTQKSKYCSSLLQRAGTCVENLQVFKVFWKAFKKFYKCDAEFVNFLGEIDWCGENIIGSVSQNNNPEIFLFVIQELKTIATRKEIKSLLTNVSASNRNCFHTVTKSNLFAVVWNVICEFLDASEILELLQNCDYKGISALMDADSKWDFHKVFDPKWDAVLGFIRDHEVMSDEVQKNIEICEKLIDTFDSLRNGEDDEKRELLKLKWLRTKSLRLLDCPEVLRREITKSGLFGCAYDFYVLANCENFEIHEISWEFILKKYENREDLVKLVTKRSVHGSIFIHIIMSNKNIEIIKFILKIINDNLNEVQIREILAVKCSKEVNLLSVAVRDSKNLQIVQILWKIYKKLFSSSEIFDIITTHCSSDTYYTDEKSSSNIILHAAASSADVFQFIWIEVRKLINKNEQQKFEELIKQENSNKQNILHVCIKQNDAELLKVVWNEVRKLFEKSLNEFKLIIKNESKIIDGYRTINLNILQLANKNDNLEFHETLWQLLCETFEDLQELSSLIAIGIENLGQIEEDLDEIEDSVDDNVNAFTDMFLNQLLRSQKLNIIKFTLENIKKVFNRKIIKQILKPQKGRSFLENSTNCMQTHQFLWEIYLEYCDDEHLSSDFFSKIILNAVTCSAEIFEFTWNKIKEQFNEYPEMIIEGLRVHNGSKENIFHVCVKQKDKELLKCVWTEVEELFTSQDWMELFKELLMEIEGIFKYPNILVHASKVNDVEFHKTLWELFLKSFGNPEILKNTLIENVGYYGIFMYDYVNNSDVKVTNFLHNFLLENFTNIQIRDLFKARSELYVTNFLESCICNLHNDFPKFVLWWKFFKTVFQTSEKFVEFFIQEIGFSCAFTYSSDQILELIINNFKNVMTREEIKKIFRNSDENGINILYLSIRRYDSCNSYKSSETLKFYKTTWKIVHEYFDQQEISDMVKQLDDKGQNILQLAVCRYSVELIEFLWAEIKKNLSYRDQIKYLSAKVPKEGKNLYNCASNNLWHKNEVKLWVERVFQEYGIKLKK